MLQIGKFYLSLQNQSTVKQLGYFILVIMPFYTFTRQLIAVALLSGALAPAARAQAVPSKLVPPFGPPRKHYLFAQKEVDCPVVANVTKNTDEDADVSGSYTKVCYRSPAEMLLEINELRKIHTWADSTYARRLAALPPGGALVVTLHRQGPKGADPAYLFCTAKTKDGQEILKDYNLKPGTGRFFGRDLYQSQQLVPFPKVDPANWPIALTINDSRLRQLFEYTLAPPAN